MKPLLLLQKKKSKTKNGRYKNPVYLKKNKPTFIKNNKKKNKKRSIAV